MARIFNIYFFYRDVMHNAIVSVRITPFFTEYSLVDFDEFLLELLPGTKIVSRGPNHFVFKNATPDNSTVLMTAIIKAVKEHLQTTTA